MFISHLLPKLFIPGESSVQREKIEKNENLKLLPKFIVNMETLKAAALPSFYCLNVALASENNHKNLAC